MIKRHPVSLASLSALSIVLSGYTGVLNAIEIDLDAFLSARYSSNSLQTDQDEKNEISPNLGLFLRASDTTTQYEALLDYGWEERWYSQNTFEDESNITGRANLKWIFSPRVLSWSIDNQRAETRIDASGSDIQDNRQVTDTWSTGPDYSLFFNAADQLNLKARFATVSVEDTDTDSDRIQWAASYLRPLDQTTSMAITAEATDVRFDDSQNLDFKRYDVFGRWQGQRSESFLQVDLGVNQVNRDVVDNVTGGLFRFLWEQDLSLAGLFSLSYEQELSDETTALQRSASADFNQPVEGNTDSTDIFYSRQWRINYDLEGPTGPINFNLAHQTLDYEVIDSDERSWRFNASTTYLLSPTLSSLFFFSYERRKFTEQLVDSDFLYNKDWNYGVRFDYRLQRNMSVQAELLQRFRSSNLDDFQVTQVNILMRYGF